MPLDPDLVAEVRSWLLKASKDLAVAKYELQAEPPFSEDILFHSQQAAEKSLKAFLTWHPIPFRKTPPGGPAHRVRLEVSLSGRSRGSDE